LRAQVIADNTWADSKGTPCIIVMPNGHVIPPQPGQKYDTAGNRTAFGRELLDEIIPLVESRYRVKRGPENRAVAGLSMGARHALLVALWHPERFAWVGSMSGGGLSATELDQLSPDTLNRRMKLIWISCGRSDGHFLNNRALVAAFDERKIRHVWHEVDGDHTHMVWKRDLAELLTILFRERPLTIPRFA
jgi:enterochelin esterase family protein